MAVTFFNRLIVSGPPARVSDFEARAKRTFERGVGKTRWTEHMPISFDALALITPIFPGEGEIWEPYDISAWPLRRVSPRRAEIRYQFETRGVGISPAVQRLSRKLPLLMFRLMTLCADDGSVDTWQIRAGKMRDRRISGRRREFHWEAARRNFGMEGDDIYEDDDAVSFVEERMCAEALGSWEKRGGKPRRLNWIPNAVFGLLDDPGPGKRDLVTEAFLGDQKAHLQERKAKPAISGARKRTRGRS